MRSRRESGDTSGVQQAREISRSYAEGMANYADRAVILAAESRGYQSVDVFVEENEQEAAQIYREAESEFVQLARKRG